VILCYQKKKEARLCHQAMAFDCMGTQVDAGRTLQQVVFFIVMAYAIMVSLVFLPCLPCWYLLLIQSHSRKVKQNIIVTY